MPTPLNPINTPPLHTRRDFLAGISSGFRDRHAGPLMKSPFEFKQHGQSGKWASSLFPEQAKVVDEMAFLMAMQGRSNVHGQSAYLMNNGFLLPGFPCMGAWISYALGNLTDNLPTFIELPDARGLPYNGRGCFTSGFLPAVH